MDQMSPENLEISPLGRSISSEGMRKQDKPEMEQIEHSRARSGRSGQILAEQMVTGGAKMIKTSNFLHKALNEPTYYPSEPLHP